MVVNTGADFQSPIPYNSRARRPTGSNTFHSSCFFTSTPPRARKPVDGLALSIRQTHDTTRRSQCFVSPRGRGLRKPYDVVHVRPNGSDRPPYDPSREKVSQRQAEEPRDQSLVELNTTDAEHGGLDHPGHEERPSKLMSDRGSHDETEGMERKPKENGTDHHQTQGHQCTRDLGGVAVPVR